MLRPSNTSSQTSIQSPSNSVKTLECSGKAFMIQRPSTPSEQMTPCCCCAREIVATAQSRFDSVLRAKKMVHKPSIRFVNLHKIAKKSHAHKLNSHLAIYSFLIGYSGQESLLLDNSKNQYLVIAVIQQHAHQRPQYNNNWRASHVSLATSPPRGRKAWNCNYSKSYFISIFLFVFLSFVLSILLQASSTEGEDMYYN